MADTEFVRMCRPLMAGLRLRTNFYPKPEMRNKLEQQLDIFQGMCTEVKLEHF